MKDRTLNILYSVALVIIFVCKGFAGDDGGQPGAFSRLGVGSRALALGSAYTSLAMDASAIFWNAAGLARIPRREFSGTFSFLTLDRQRSFVSFANTFSDVITIGIGWSRFAINNIDGRDELGRPTQKFDDDENSIMIAVGKRWDDFAIGVTGKYLHHSLFDRSASGFGLDLGMNMRFYQMIHVGLVLQDLLGELNWNTNNNLQETLPLTLRGGVSLQTDAFPVVVAFEAVKVGKIDPILKAGCELKIVEYFGIRGGFDGENATFGGLVRLPGESYDIQLDYAATRDVLENGFVHHVSLRFSF